MLKNLFLIDESLSPSLVLKFRSLGYRAIAVRDIGKGSDDNEIIKFAMKNSAIIVAADLDFGMLWYWYYHGALGVIVLRLRSQKLKSQEAVIDFLHREKVLENQDINTSLVISTEGRYRIKRADN